jgi:hypothetical protein
MPALPGNRAIEDAGEGANWALPLPFPILPELSTRAQEFGAAATGSPLRRSRQRRHRSVGCGGIPAWLALRCAIKASS